MPTGKEPQRNTSPARAARAQLRFLATLLRCASCLWPREPSPMSFTPSRLTASPCQGNKARMWLRPSRGSDPGPRALETCIEVRDPTNFPLPSNLSSLRITLPPTHSCNAGVWAAHPRRELGGCKTQRRAVHSSGASFFAKEIKCFISSLLPHPRKIRPLLPQDPNSHDEYRFYTDRSVFS